MPQEHVKYIKHDNHWNKSFNKKSFHSFHIQLLVLCLRFIVQYSSLSLKTNFDKILASVIDTETENNAPPHILAMTEAFRASTVRVKCDTVCHVLLLSVMLVCLIEKAAVFVLFTASGMAESDGTQMCATGEMRL